MDQQELTLEGARVEPMRDTQFMSAAEKEKVLRQWKSFLASGLQWEKFTKPLYHHLIQHCSFIAHYDRSGFYATYFQEGDDTAHFLSQFDGRKAVRSGIPKSVEYGMTWWVSGDYVDINMAMIDIAGKYIPDLLARATNSQMTADLNQAKILAERWGRKVTTL